MDGFTIAVIGSTAGVLALSAIAISASFFTNYGERRREMKRGLREIENEFDHLKPGRDITGANFRGNPER